MRSIVIKIIKIPNKSTPAKTMPVMPSLCTWVWWELLVVVLLVVLLLVVLLLVVLLLSGML